MQSDEQQYIKGFNNGYLIARHEPDLAAKLTAQPNEHNNYFDGFVSGKEQYARETSEWLKSFSRDTPAKEDRDIDRNR